MELDNLSLDPVTVNTDLAENYLKKYKNFDCFPEPETFWHIITKIYPDKWVGYNIKEYEEYVEQLQVTDPIGPYDVRNLVQKIHENETLFYELEYLIRKTSETDVKNYLTLICQHLQCDEDPWRIANTDTNHINICMNGNTPLYVLGAVAAGNIADIRVTIVSTREMAPICYLFTDLCTQVGWKISLIFANDLQGFESTSIPHVLKINYQDNECDYQCTGVVTETADIDSALDVFIDSTVTAPWKLRRIYVQQSVYEEVKDALAAKCNHGGGVHSRDDTFAVQGKVFICEDVGEGEGARVSVEAYRTVRELCALLRLHPTAALSLWAADSQVAHEVALAAPATLVWINEYASFHGPPASSLPLYEQICPRRSYMFNKSDVEDLKIRWARWSKLTKNERVVTVLGALQHLTTLPGNLEVVDLQNLILKGRDDSFVSVDDGKICMGVERPAQFEHFVVLNDNHSVLVDYIKSSINGAALLQGFSDSLQQLQVFHALKEAGVPVLCDYNEAKPLIKITQTRMPKLLKVVRSNFGTIFAN